MKLNKNKIIVSALALAIGGSLAGSVGGTIAWYQYSTRANVSFLGDASGISGNLQMRFVGQTDSDWTTRITKETLAGHITGGGHLKPMTFGGLGMTDPLPANGYLQPAAGNEEMANWGTASAGNYAQFSLELRYVERDGVKVNNVDDANAEKEVYISDILIQEDFANDAGHARSDISDAVRLHISSSYNDGQAHEENRLISNQGGTTITHGALDLDGDGEADKAYAADDEYGFKDGATLSELDYGDAGTQVAFKADDVGGEHTYYDEDDAAQTETVYPACVTRTAGSLDLTNTDKQTIPNVGDVEKYIGKTMEDEDNYLTVTVTIWVEGWHRFDAYKDRQDDPKFMSIWDADLVDAVFDLGIQFAVDED